MNHSTDEFERIMLDYLKGDITPEDMRKMLLFLKEDKACREKYREISYSYAIASSSWFEQRKEQNLKQLRNALGFHSSHKRVFLHKMRVGAYAAIGLLLICCSITCFYLYHFSVPKSDVTSLCRIEIPFGSTSKLILPDSTVVFLNGGTTLEYDASLLSKDTRDVFLCGEACFEVTENINKAFIVHTKELDVKVLGTIFDIASYANDEEVKVSLLSGKLNVLTVSDSPQSILLSPNEQVVYKKESKELYKRETKVENEVKWISRKLVFVNERLLDILKSIEKQYGIQILIQSEKVNEEYFSGSIDTNMGLDEILSYLDVDNKFVFKKQGEQLIITDK